MEEGQEVGINSFQESIMEGLQLGRELFETIGRHIAIDHHDIVEVEFLFSIDFDWPEPRMLDQGCKIVFSVEFANKLLG